MSDLPQHAGQEQAREQAVDWFVRRDAGDLSPREQAAFRAWLAASPANEQAYAEIERLWSELDSLPRERDTKSGAESVVRDSPASSRIPAVLPEFLRPAWLRPGVLTAGVALACVVLALALDLPQRVLADARTGVGETRMVPLPDGSSALLNTASAIAVDFSPEARRVRLLKGEAVFTPVDSGGAPFVVETPDGSSTALGTIFQVRRHADNTSVTVIESRVAVSAPAEAGRVDEQVLIANQRLTYAAGLGLGPIETVDPRQATAWQRGRLIFEDLPLDQVVAELNRYHAGRIYILDETLGAMRVSGVFDTRNAVAALDSLEASLALRSTRLTDLLILVHR